MKNSFGVIACALSMLFYFCSGDYFVGEGSLYDHGIYDGSKDSLAYDPYNMGYFCQSTQMTFFDDLASPTPLALLTGGQSPTTHSHDTCVRFFKLQLSSTDIRKYISVEAKITKDPSERIFPLFAYKIGSPPLMKIKRHISGFYEFIYNSVQFDFNSKLFFPIN